MKSIIIILSLLAVAVILLIKVKSRSKTIRNVELINLDSNQGSSKFLPVVSKEFLSESQEKYRGREYDLYKNTHSELAGILVNKVYQDAKYWERNQSHAQFINQLSRAQKLYFALVNFEGQVNNGGVYQFLFNQPEFSLIVLDAMKAAEMDRLHSDYKNVLEEYLGKFETIQQLNAKFQDGGKNWEKRWNSFVSGYKEVPSATRIEEYFYTKEFKMEFHQKMVNFVLNNQSELFQVKN